MNAITQEWIAKAEEDLRAARREAAVDGCAASFGVAAFLAQQAAEKYLKALLHGRGIYFPRTHDLVELLTLLTPPETRLDALGAELEGLSACAVAVRYPGASIDEAEATEAVELAEQVRAICLDLLGLES